MKIIALIAAVVTGIIVLAGGLAYAQMPASSKMLDVGVALPLTGPAASLGSDVRNAVSMAINDQNAQGGVKIAGERYLLNPIILDTKKDASVGKSVAEQLVYEKKVKIVIGPFIDDAVGAQPVLESNKIVSFLCVASTPDMTGPSKPYSFFYGGVILQMFTNGAGYIRKFYPNAKSVVSMNPDIPDTPEFLNAAQAICKRYGLEWLGAVKFPFGTTDFSPFITQVLAKHPDVVDTGSTGGAMGGLCAQLVKQLRQAGFKGLIWVPASTAPGVVDEVVPENYRTKIVDNNIDWEAPIVSDAYRDFCRRYVKQYKTVPSSIAPLAYHSVKPFFEFLNGQDAMDTTKWMEGFAAYHWKGIYGKEAFWVGEPLVGINRMLLRHSWISEYINGKLETRYESPIPMELFVQKK